MSVLSWTTEVTGLEGVTPKIIYIETNDTYATITTAGYLNPSVDAGMEFTNHAMALVLSTTGVLWLQTSVINGVHSLITPSSQAGVIVLPTIANHIATYTDTAGTLSEDPVIAISAGGIQSGLNGTAGALITFPATPNTGSLRLISSSNLGNYINFITNAALNQSTTFTLPDPGSASTNIAVTTGATVANNLVMASGTDGQIIDSGISAASLAPVTVSGTISAAAFYDMYNTPVQLIPTPGAGLGILVLTAYLEVIVVTNATANGGAIVFQYGPGAQATGFNTIINGGTTTIPASFANATFSNQFTTLTNGVNIGNTVSGFISNKGVFLSNDTAVFDANGGASFLRYSIIYMVVPSN